jgi:UDP-galactopyranose mutase
MSLNVDFLVIGSGLTGATIARTLVDAGCEVLVLERRDHLGGNVHDHLHTSGIRVHTYGPHYFRTNSQEIWEFVNRFGDFFPYEAVVKTFVGGKLEQWPITAEYISRAVGADWKPRSENIPENFEEACLATMPRVVYEKFVKGYTEKQWGTSALNLSPNLASRFDVRLDNDPRFSKHKHQGIPRDGYADFTQRLLQGVPVLLNCDYLTTGDHFRARRLLIFTGAIDEFFSYDLGKLCYRAQRRKQVFLDGIATAQPCGQVNNPNLDNGAHIRTLEWKHMMPAEQRSGISGTVLTREYPYTPQDSDHYEYPFPDRRNEILYQAYRSRVSEMNRVRVCGRLGEYRYFDMDQAIGRALRIARKILHSLPIAIRQIERPVAGPTAGLRTAASLLGTKKNVELGPRVIE